MGPMAANAGYTDNVEDAQQDSIQISHPKNLISNAQAEDKHQDHSLNVAAHDPASTVGAPKGANAGVLN